MFNNKVIKMKKVLSLLLIVCFTAVLVMLQGCKKATVPELTTVGVTQITINSASSGGTVISDGGEDITEKGVCWSRVASPTIADSKTSDGVGSANFTSNMVGLAEGQPYFVRAYAINSVGTAYGNEVTFTTSQVTGAVLTTTAATNLTSTTATAGGNITNAGGGTISARGVCWSSTFQSPTIDHNKFVSGTGEGIFTSTITGLTDGTIYYYRAFATNSFGTSYGEPYQFITPVTDVEGNIYKTVKIGTQVWMAENLKTTRYNNDTQIPNTTDNTAWKDLSTGAYCWYMNDEATNKNSYGAIYNWYAVSSGTLCPTGWHMPGDEDFITLEYFLGLPVAAGTEWEWRGTDQGKQMKNTTGWAAGQNGTNSSGFSALPSGYRYYENGTFAGVGLLGYWWTSSPANATTAYYRRLDGDNDKIYRASAPNSAGKSVRCVKN